MDPQMSVVKFGEDSIQLILSETLSQDVFQKVTYIGIS